MKTMTRQRGLTFIGFLTVAILLVFLAIFGMKIIPVYVQDRTIKSIFDAIVNAPEMQGAPAKEIRESFDKRAMMNNITVVSFTDINVETGPAGIQLSVSYSVKVPLVANASLLFEFETSSTKKR